MHGGAELPPRHSEAEAGESGVQGHHQLHLETLSSAQEAL